MDDQTDYSDYYYIHVNFRSVAMTVAVMREQREPEFLMLVCCSANVKPFLVHYSFFMGSKLK